MMSYAQSDDSRMRLTPRAWRRAEEPVQGEQEPHDEFLPNHCWGPPKRLGRYCIQHASNVLFLLLPFNPRISHLLTGVHIPSSCSLPPSRNETRSSSHSWLNHLHRSILRQKRSKSWRSSLLMQSQKHTVSIYDHANLEYIQETPTIRYPSTWSLSTHS